MNIHCKVTKLGSVQKPKYDGDTPIYDGYTVLGYATTTPQVGRSLAVNRYNRNGLEVDGLFITSTITLIKPRTNGFYFRTQNSRYQFTILPDKKT